MEKVEVVLGFQKVEKVVELTINLEQLVSKE